MNQIHNITSDGFECEVLSQKVPVVVDFYSIWCGPCELMGNVLAQLIDPYRDRVKFVKINIEEAYHLIHRFNLHCVPTLLTFHNGQLVGRIEGFTSAQEIECLVDRLAQLSPVVSSYLPYQEIL